MTRSLILVATLAALLSAGQSSACAGLDVKQPWIREAPPGASTLVAYMQLHNRLDRPLIIRAIESESFSGSMLHTTQIVDGISQMRHLERISIAPGGDFTLGPGATHLMLFSPLAPLQQGDSITLDVLCTEGQHGHYSVPVRKQAP